jgi:hypothetical protein
MTNLCRGGGMDDEGGESAGVEVDGHQEEPLSSSSSLAAVDSFLLMESVIDMDVRQDHDFWFYSIQVERRLAVAFHSKWDKDMQFHSILNAAKTGGFVPF